jgi:hypothetical protein
VIPGEPAGPAIITHMWPFSSKKAPEDTAERLARLELAMKRLQEDWTETYGKFRTLQMRVAKQAQRAEELVQQHEDAQPGGGEEAPTPRSSSLTPRQQKLQDEILQRRARLTASGGE